ncbi:MAG TPA: hypothetical protein VNN21_08065 [Dehalococcoidia bacterium]|nr:hypothetical protein [Dehalococcoidia bacterium]
MPARTSTPLKQAFQRFVELVKPIPQVKHVVGFEQGQDIYTYIESRDEDVMKKVFRAEDKVFDEFPETLIEFHVVYLEGRPLEDFVRPLPKLVFSR